MKNLSRFIPIDGGQETVEDNEETFENGERIEYGNNVGESEGTLGSGLTDVETAINNIESELEGILGGTNKEIKNIEGTGGNGTEIGGGEFSGDDGNVGYNGGTEVGVGITGESVESEVGITGEIVKSEVENVEGGYTGGPIENGNIGGVGTETTDSGSKFKVCGTNLPAKVSFWSKLKNFFKIEIEVSLNKKDDGATNGTNENISGGEGNGIGGNTSGGTGWSGFKKFFSFGKKSN